MGSIPNLLRFDWLAIGAALACLNIFSAEALAGTYQGTALIEGSSGIVRQQRATSFALNPVLPRDFSGTGVLAPGTYAISFELISSGTASDDPNDDQSINQRDFEYQLLTGNFSFDLQGGSYSVTGTSHEVTLDSNNMIDPTLGGVNLDQSSSSSDPAGFSDSLANQTSSPLGQYGFAAASLNSVAGGSSFGGSGSTRMVSSNTSGLAAGATGGNNYVSALSKSRWLFVVSAEVAYTLTSHFDGSGSPGLTQQTALLPKSFAASTQSYSFATSLANVWVEQLAAGSVLYTTTDGSLFTGILAFPSSVDSDDLFDVAAGGMALGQFAVGDTVDFGAGVSSFTVSGIQIAPVGSLPGTFPIQLSLDTGTAAFDAMLLPEPSAALLGVVAVGCVALLRRMRPRSS